MVASTSSCLLSYLPTHARYTHQLYGNSHRCPFNHPSSSVHIIHSYVASTQALGRRIAPWYARWVHSAVDVPDVTSIPVSHDSPANEAVPVGLDHTVRTIPRCRPDRECVSGAAIQLALFQRFQLNWQSVAIPTRYIAHVFALKNLSEYTVHSPRKCMSASGFIPAAKAAIVLLLVAKCMKSQSTTKCSRPNKPGTGS